MVEGARQKRQHDLRSEQGQPVPANPGGLRQGEEDSLEIEEAPELDDEDEAILDRIWDNLPPDVDDDLDDEDE